MISNARSARTLPEYAAPLGTSFLKPEEILMTRAGDVNNPCELRKLPFFLKKQTKTFVILHCDGSNDGRGQGRDRR